MKAFVACSPGTFIGSDSLWLSKHIIPHDLEMFIEVVGVASIEVKPSSALRPDTSHFTHGYCCPSAIYVGKEFPFRVQLNNFYDIGLLLVI